MGCIIRASTASCVGRRKRLPHHGGQPSECKYCSNLRLLYRSTRHHNPREEIGGSVMTVKRLAQGLCALTLLCGCIFAQTTSATLQGTVVDPGDAAVPGISIELKNTATGAVRSATSTAEGIFRFNSIEPAAY